MLTHLHPTVEDLPSPHPALVVLEWAALTLLLPLLGLWYHRADPFFLQASFPWLMLAPPDTLTIVTSRSRLRLPVAARSPAAMMLL